MNILSRMVVLLLVLSMANPVLALKEISVDFDTGKVTERMEKSPSDEKSATSPDEPEPPVDNTRLKRVIEGQQRLIQRQQAVLEQQREEIRRQERINRGLEMLRRSGK